MTIKWLLVNYNSLSVISRHHPDHYDLECVESDFIPIIGRQVPMAILGMEIGISWGCPKVRHKKRESKHVKERDKTVLYTISIQQKNKRVIT